MGQIKKQKQKTNRQENLTGKQWCRKMTDIGRCVCGDRGETPYWQWTMFTFLAPHYFSEGALPCSCPPTHLGRLPKSYNFIFPVSLHKMEKFWQKPPPVVIETSKREGLLTWKCAGQYSIHSKQNVVTLTFWIQFTVRGSVAIYSSTIQ